MACLRRIEDRNLLDTAHRALSENDSLFRYAKKRKYVKHNIVADLRGPDTLPRAKVKHNAAITDPAQVAPLLRAIDPITGDSSSDARCGCCRLSSYVLASCNGPRGRR